MKQTIEISDELAALLQDYLQQNPGWTLTSLVQEALIQKLQVEQPEPSDPNQIEQFMALSGIVKQASRHSDEHAEDEID